MPRGWATRHLRKVLAHYRLDRDAWRPLPGAWRDAVIERDAICWGRKVSRDIIEAGVRRSVIGHVSYLDLITLMADGRPSRAVRSPAPKPDALSIPIDPAAEVFMIEPEAISKVTGRLT